MEQTEEELELDAAALQVLEFLGEVHVNLAGYLAVEEFTCEQYAASIRFLRRCTSVSCHSEHLSLEKSSRSNKKILSGSNPEFLKRVQKTEKKSAHHDKRFAREKSEDLEVRDGVADDVLRLKDIKSLCDSIDLVLAKAKHARETYRSSCLSTPSDDKVAAAKRSSNNRVAIAKARERGPQKLALRSSKKSQMKPFHSQKPCAEVCHHVENANLENSNAGPNLEITSNAESSLSQTDSESSKGIIEETAHDTFGKKLWDRSRLKIPEKLRTLVAWFNVRGILLDDPLGSPTPTKPLAAKENFLSLLNDAGNQQQRLDDREWSDAAARIQETQNVLKELASLVSPFEMSRLLRVAPTGFRNTKAMWSGSAIAKQRECFGKMQESTVLSLEKNLCSNIPALATMREQPQTLSWLPQDCWAYFGRAVEAIQRVGSRNIIQILEKRDISYTEAEHVVAIAKLWHLIHVNLLQCYLEEVVAAPLLPERPRNDSEPSLLYFFRYRLAHSILCTEGRNLMVVAEWTTTSNFF